MRKFYLAVIVLLTALPAFSQLYKVENAEKEQNSTLVVEGKVEEQSSFWNPQHTMIFTANKIRVYKLFKGELAADHIEVMTIGGTVGNESVQASDLLELSKDEIGVFFCFPNQGNILSPSTGNRLYDIYASSQGCFKYDVFKNVAGDPFNTFNGISEQLYPAIVSLTKHNYTVIDASFNPGNIYSTSLSAKTTALIIGFTPTTVNAGATADVANNVLTISGTGFGTASGSAAVLFWDANNNNGTPNYVVAYTASEMISWTDTEIKLRVPTRAGTGVFSVRDAGGVSTASPQALIINYSILSSGGKQTNLINANGSGGYSMKYSSNMTPEATATFNRALETWVEVSGLNVINGGTTGIESVTGDGNCVVMMDNFNANGGTPLSAGVLGVCYSFSQQCSSSFDVRKPEFDIVLRSAFSSGSVNFSYGPCAPGNTQIDFETVILHELGHGLNLGHINDGAQGAAPNANAGKLMHYAVSNGVKRVSPDHSAYEGSLYAINGVTTSYGPCTTNTNMTPLTGTVDPRDEMPLTFPAIATGGGITVPFDLEHATSNKKNDPPYNIILCTPVATGTNITNNVYLPIRTSVAGGDLTMTVSDFQLTPASSGSDCTGGNIPTFRMAVFYRLTMPTSPDDYGDPIACRSFTGNGAITTITGLLPNSTYLLYIDGKANQKGTFKITFNGTALPLKFEKFLGEVKKDHNLLTWSIATSNDVEKLVLQKSSNGADFTSLYEQHDLATGRDYNYADYKPFAGKNYYRLGVYNKDGSIQYSSIVLLNNDRKVSVSVYPNPVKDRLNIAVSTVENMKDVQVRLYNSIGQLVISKTASLTTGLNIVDLNMSALAPGIYQLQVSDSKGNLVSGNTIQK
jgi:hypothetical protein